MEEIDLLFEEYKLSTQRIEDYQEKHLSFYKSILLVLTGLIFFYDNEKSKEIKEYLFVLPYILITLFMLIHYHYHRTLIVQGHRKALEEIINTKVGNGRFPLVFGKLSQRFIITPKGNPGIIVFTLLNLVGFIFLVRFCNPGATDQIHLWVQSGLALVIFFFFVQSTRKAEKQSFDYFMQNYKP